jgi:hypothetical protein
MEYEVGFLEQLPPDPEVLVVVNRLAAGEYVYGPLLRGKSRLSRGGLLHCEMLYESLGALRIMMMPSLAILLQRLRTRGDDLIDAGDMAYIREQYAFLAPRYNWMQITDTPEQGRLRTWIEIVRRRGLIGQQLQEIVPGYVGTLRPRFILAGDVRAGNPAHDPYKHAFTPAAYGAAETLMNSLAPYSRNVLRQYGIMNTMEEGLDLRKANEFLDHPEWIALGRLAAGRLNDAGIPHLFVPHPSYVRRFGKRTIEEYGCDIMTLSESDGMNAGEDTHDEEGPGAEEAGGE